MNCEIFNSYREVNEDKIVELLKKEISNDRHKIVVLDDDPTGVQTIHDLNVYTDMCYESVLAGFKETNKAFFLLTNSRGLLAKDTFSLHKRLKEYIEKASMETGKDYIVVSRSDSTLRGQFPLETETLNNGYDGEILCPFFKEGGRFTINNIHYVKDNGQLIEVGKSEFAKDKTFGYLHSDLREYIEEKTKGNYKADSVICISLEDLRAENIDKIYEQLKSVKEFNKVVVNAIDYCDLKVFSIAFYRALKQGKRFIFRSAASLVKVLAGIETIDLLKKEQMIKKNSVNGGIVIVGSHTEKTTAQLKKLLSSENVAAIEFDSDKVLEGKEILDKEVERCVNLEKKAILDGKTAVCFTNRKLLSLEEDTKEMALKRSVEISESVCQLVGLLDVEPAFVIAKGGITSSDVGTKALKVKKAIVLGQILPSIPVWRLCDESKFPDMPYIIFPGNTGDEDSLLLAVRKLRGVKINNTK